LQPAAAASNNEMSHQQQIDKVVDLSSVTDSQTVINELTTWCELIYSHKARFTFAYNAAIPSHNYAAVTYLSSIFALKFC